MCIQEISNIRVLLFQSENVSGPNSKASQLESSQIYRKIKIRKKKIKKSISHVRCTDVCCLLLAARGSAAKQHFY